MLFDCFLFNNELELLKLRLHTLRDVVDKHVLCEVAQDYSTREKRLHFADHREEFAEFLSHIAHLTPRVEWASAQYVSTRERMAFYAQQQCALSLALVDAKDSDVVMLSDVDEIPRPGMVSEAVRLLGAHRTVGILCRYYYYYLNGYRGNAGWYGPILCTVGTLREYGSFRALYLDRKKCQVALPDAGWHFSYLGGPARVAEKLRAGGHVEFTGREYTDTDRLACLIEEGRLFQDGRRIISYVPIDETFPLHVRSHIDEYADVIHKVEGAA